MADVGFLDQLGIGTQDEAAVSSQIQQQRLNTNDRFARNFQLGRQAAPFVGGIGAGIAGLFSREGRTAAGFRDNVARDRDWETIPS